MLQNFIEQRFKVLRHECQPMFYVVDNTISLHGVGQVDVPLRVSEEKEPKQLKHQGKGSNSLPRRISVQTAVEASMALPRSAVEPHLGRCSISVNLVRLIHPSRRQSKNKRALSGGDERKKIIALVHLSERDTKGGKLVGRRETNRDKEINPCFPIRGGNVKDVEKQRENGSKRLRGPVSKQSF